MTRMKSKLTIETVHIREKKEKNKMVLSAALFSYESKLTNILILKS